MKSIFVSSLLFSLIFSFIFSTLFISQAEAVFNKQINYQGKLTTSANIAVSNGTYNMEFKLYTVPSAGTAIWTETRISTDKVQVTNGLFSVMLGEVTALSGVDFNQTLYLGINIGGTGTPGWDGEMTPRKKLGAVPAAVESERVGGFTPSQTPTGSDIPVLSGGALTMTGAVYSPTFDASSAVALNLGTTTQTALTLGRSGASTTINSNTWGVTSAGAFSGISTIGMSGQLTSTLATGTSPLAVTSTTLNTNLNADYLDGQHGSYYATASSLGSYVPYTGATANVDLGTYSLTSPTILGGTSTTADLNLQTTSGVGATGADMHFKVGNAGATEAMTILNDGKVGINNTNPTTHQLMINGSVQIGTGFNYTPSVTTDLTVGSGTQTSRFLFGQSNSAYGGMQWNYSATPSAGYMAIGLMNGDGNKGFTLFQSGNIGVGHNNPSALFHLKGGTASANTAPLKFSSGTNLTTAEAGAMEYDGTNLYFTPSGTTRKTVAYTSDIAGYVPYTGATANVNLGAYNLTLPAGTVGTPGLKIGAGTAGVIGTGTNDIALVSNGINVATFVASSATDVRFQINTTNYSTMFGQYEGDWFGVTNPMIMQPLSPATAHDIAITGTQNSPTNGIVIKAGGNVGIGTTGPGSKLTVNNETSTSLTLLGKSSDSLLGIHSGNSSIVGNYSQIGFGYNNVYSPVSIGSIQTSATAYGIADLVFATRALTTDTAPIERMRITSAGDIGIGDTNPSTGDRVEIVGALRIHTGNDWDAMRITSDGANGYITGLGDETGLHIRSEFGNIFLADDRGNVGIGTTGPDAILHAKGGTAMTSGWNRTATLEATFPSLVFNSNNTKWAGIQYDYTSNLNIRVGATSNDINASGVSALSFNGTTGAATFGSSVTTGGNLILGANTITTTNTGLVSNLNADMLDGLHASAFGATRSWSGTVTAGNTKPLARFYDTEGTVSQQITVQSKTSANSGTKTYLFQGGYGQFGSTYPGSWYKLQPTTTGRGHGEFPAQFDVYIRQGTDGYTYDVGISATTTAKVLKVTFNDLTSGSNTYTDISAQAEVATTSAGDIYSNMNANFGGNVGIGTTSPGKLLTVRHGSSDGIRVEYTGNNDNLLIDASNMQAYSTTTPSNLKLNPSGGNVGIGTTDPQARISIANSTAGSQRLLYLAEPGYPAGSGGSAYGLSLYGNSSDGVFKFYGMNSGVETTNPILVMNRTNGNVGIGTTGPGGNLEVKAVTTSADGILRLTNSTNDTATSAFDLQWQSGSTIAGGIRLSNPSANVTNMEFSNWNSTARTIRMGIYGTNGNVGIGTTSPGSKLTVDNSGTYSTNYSWTGSSIQTNSIEVMDRYAGSTSDGIYPTLTLHDYGAGGAQFSMEGATTTLHLGSGQTNSAGTLATGSTYFSKLKVWGALETTGNTSAANYLVAAGNGNGICFWADCTNYKVSMGNTAEYVYGSVTGYSIKTTMNNQPGWGFSWGAPGVAPVASLEVQTGNMKIAGNFMEKYVSFTPTTVGWYRIATGSSQGGVIRIIGSYDNVQTDVELQYYVGAWGTNGSIQETRYSSYNGGVVSQARISDGGAGTSYLDIYISTATAPAPVTIYGYGPNMPSFVASPVVGAVAGSTNVRTLTLGHGFRSTNGAIFAETSGNVGIGTTGPGAKLHVSDSATAPATGTAIIESTGGNSNLVIKSANTSSYAYQTFNQGGVGKFEMGVTGDTSSNFYINSNVQSGPTNASIFIKKSNGNVGIGDTDPSYSLQVGGPGTPTINIVGSTGQLFVNNIAPNTGSNLYLNANVGVGTASPSKKFQVVGGSDTWSGIALGDNGGDIPTVSFRVSDNSQRAKIEINGVNGAGGDRLGLFAYNSGVLNEVVSVKGGGNVGIGTTGPGSKLDILASGTTNTIADPFGVGANITSPTQTVQGSTLSLDSNDAQAIDTGGVLGFGGRYNTGTGYANWASVKGLKANSTDGDYGGYLSFWTRLTGASSVERMRIDNTGNVGIGTTGPAGRLNINETTGTVNGAAQGSLIIDHANSGGASSIVFRSAVNRGSDYGFIQYQDSTTVGGGGESAKLIIGTSNDTDDDIVISPSGNVGVKKDIPVETLDVVGSIGLTGSLKFSTAGFQFDQVASPASVTVKKGADSIMVFDEL